jgi:uncharacterized protein YegP (UPF0339 family)
LRICTFRFLKGVGRVTEDARTPNSDKGGLVSASSDLEFLIIHDVKDGYRWRLRSAARGETVDYSQRGHRHKDECEREVNHLREHKYPGAHVRDLSARG